MRGTNSPPLPRQKSYLWIKKSASPTKSAWAQPWWKTKLGKWTRSSRFLKKPRLPSQLLSRQLAMLVQPSWKTVTSWPVLHGSPEPSTKSPRQQEKLGKRQRRRWLRRNKEETWGKAILRFTSRNPRKLLRVSSLPSQPRLKVWSFNFLKLLCKWERGLDLYPLQIACSFSSAWMWEM